METWEYAEIAWRQFVLRGHQATWAGPDGSKSVKGHGVEALNQAVRDGWELVEYKTAAEHWSSCLLRRPSK
jgi:hypothetical protein